MATSITPPPLFFISYVHDSGEDDEHIKTLYRDLNHDVLMFAARRASETAGFCDASFKLGQRWSPALIENLSTAQVFIPILSPVYFMSEACGKEWSIFMSRLERSGRLHSQESSIVPLLWVPMTVPEIAQQFQFTEAAFGAEYERVKLRALIREDRRRDDYRAFVEMLAQRVVDLSRSAPVVAATERPGFHDVASAFGPRVHATDGRSRPADRPRTSDQRPILNPNLTEDPR